MDRGLIHIYCGDGKGKTSAAIGLAVRAAGRGKRVLFARFLKNEDSGELEALVSIPGIEICNSDRSFGFYRTLDEETRQEAKDQYSALFDRVRQKIAKEQWDVLVLDELAAAYRYEILTPGEVLSFLKNKPEVLEIVMTGRDPAKELLELADYVSEIRKIRHPFDKGILAREGIEY